MGVVPKPFDRALAVPTAIGVGAAGAVPVAKTPAASRLARSAFACVVGKKFCSIGGGKAPPAVGLAVLACAENKFFSIAGGNAAAAAASFFVLSCLRNPIAIGVVGTAAVAITEP